MQTDNDIQRASTAEHPGAAWCDPLVRVITARLHDGVVPLADGTDTSVVGTWHRIFRLTAGVVDDRAVRAMTHGQCLAMAAALNHRTGWPVAAVMDYAYEDFEDPDDEPNRDDQMIHLGVLYPNATTFVDIRGARPVGDVVASYLHAYYGEQAEGTEVGIEIVDAAWLEVMLQDPKMRRPAMHVAVTFVDAVLATLPAQSSPLLLDTVQRPPSAITHHVGVCRCDLELLRTAPPPGAEQTIMGCA